MKSKNKEINISKFFNSKKMNKKAQFYIFTAILLSAYAFTIYANSRVIANEPSKTFKELKDNYLIEGEKVPNNAIYTNKEIENQFENFTAEFRDYAKTKNINLGIFYILINNDNIFLMNHLDSSASITTTQTYNLEINQNTTIPTTNIIILNYNNINYAFEVSSEQYQINSLLVAKKAQDIAIFVNN